MKSRFVLPASGILALLLLSGSLAFGQTWTWTGGAIDSNWSSTDNWLSGTAPASSTGTTVVLGLTGLTTAPVVDVNSPWSLASISFIANHQSVSLSGNALQFTTGGSISDAVAGTFTDTISNNITQSGTGSFSIASGSGTGGNLLISGSITTASGGLGLTGFGSGSTISGKISGTGGTSIQLTSTGYWTISNTGNLISTAYVAGGTLVLGANNAFTSGSALAFGTGGSGGTVNLNGYNQTVKEIRNDTASASTITNSSATQSVLTNTVSSSLNRTDNSTITGNLELDVAGTSSTYYYSVLTGTNTYTGATKVTGASTGANKGAGLYVNGTHTVTSGTTAAYSIGSGGWLGGSGTINLSAVNQGITFALGSKLDVGSAPATVGTLTASLGTASMNISALGGSNAGEFLFNLNTVASSDKFSLLTGTLNIGSALDFADFAFTTTGSFAPGTYVLFDTNQSITGSLAASGLSGTLAGYTSTLALSGDGQDIILNVAAVPEPEVYAMLLAGLLLLAVPRLRLRRA